MKHTNADLILQIDAKLKQAAEKKQMLEQLKRVRKGKSADLDFLDDNKGKNNKGKPSLSNRAAKKRASKDKKFGFGGKKKGSKLNTRESSSQMDGFNSSSKKRPTNFKNKNFKPNSKKQQRPGKSKRKNAKR